MQHQSSARDAARFDIQLARTCALVVRYRSHSRNNGLAHLVHPPLVEPDDSRTDRLTVLAKEAEGLALVRDRHARDARRLDLCRELAQRQRCRAPSVFGILFEIARVSWASGIAARPSATGVPVRSHAIALVAVVAESIPMTRSRAIQGLSNSLNLNQIEDVKTHAHRHGR